MAHRDGLSRKVLLIGWDAADWEHINPLLEEGLMPTLDAFINRGVMGNLATLQPILSPMLWNSAATGKFADKHGIHGFIEPDPQNGGARTYSSYARKCKALWNILSQSGLRSNVVGWWASHPAEPINGRVVTEQAENHEAFPSDKHDGRLATPTGCANAKLLPASWRDFLPRRFRIESRGRSARPALMKLWLDLCSMIPSTCQS